MLARLTLGMRIADCGLLADYGQWIYARSLGLDIDAIRGAVLVAVAAVLLALSRRAGSHD
jgi:hypothetical protein